MEWHVVISETCSRSNMKVPINYDHSLLQVPKTNGKTLEIEHLNILPGQYGTTSVRQCKTLDSFKTQLKTFLLRKAFNITF